MYIIVPPFTDPYRSELYVSIEVEAYSMISGYETAEKTKNKMINVRIIMFN